MTQITWKSGTTGSWGVATNWNGGIPNSTTADVTIAAAGAYAVSIASGASFTADSVMVANGAVGFNLLGGLTLAGTQVDFLFDGSNFTLAGSISGGTLDIDSGTLVNRGGNLNTADFVLGSGGSIALSGTALTLSGASNLAGTIYGNNSAGNSLAITGSDTLSSTGGDTYIENNTTLVDAGTITEGNIVLYLGDSSSDKSSFLINAGAIFNATIGVGYNIEQIGTGVVSNAGLFEETGDSTGYVAALFNNTGTILAGAGSDLQLDAGGTIGGTLTGGGEIDFGDKLFTFTPTITISASTLGAIDGATIDLGASLTIASALTIGGSSVLNLEGHVLALQGAGNELEGYVYGNGGAGNSLVITGSTDFSDGVQFAGNITIFDDGTITQETYAEFGTAATDQTGLVIATNAVYDVTVPGELVETDSGSLSNAGLFEASPGAGVVYVDFDLVNNGTLLAGAGSDLQFEGGGTLGGTLTGAGEINLQNGNFTLSKNVEINIATFNVGGALLLTGDNLTLAGNAALNGGGTITGPGTLLVTGAGSINAIYLSQGAVLEDAGSITQSNILYLGAYQNDTASINIDTNAFYDIYSQGGGGILGYDGSIGVVGPDGTVNNAGLLQSDNTFIYGDNNTANYVAAFVNNTGTIKSDSGDLEFENGGVIGGTLTGAGEIDLTGSPGFLLTSGVVINAATFGIGAAVTLSANLAYSGNFLLYLASSNDGVLDLNGHNLSLSGAATFGPGNAYINGPGTMTVSGPATLANLYVTGGAVLVDADTFTQTGLLQLGEEGAGTLSGALVVNAGATYILENSDFVSPNISAYGTTAIDNAGLFQIQGFFNDDLSDSIGPSFSNTGTLELSYTGTTTLQSALVNDNLVVIDFGTLAAAGAVSTDAGKSGIIDIAGSFSMFTAESSVDAGQTIALIGGYATLALADPAGFAGTITSFATGDVIDLTGIAANGFTYSGNKLVLTEATAGGAATVVGTLNLTGITASGIGLISDGSGGTDIVLNHTGTTFSNPKGVITETDWNGATAAWTTTADWSGHAVPNSLNNAAYFGSNAFTLNYNTTDVVNALESTDGAAVFAIAGGTLTDNDGGYWYGKFNVAGGTFDAATGFYFGGPVSLGTAGTLQVDSGFLALAGGGTLAGAITGGNGQILLDGGNFLLNAGLISSAYAFDFVNNSQVTLGASQTFANNFVIADATLDLKTHYITISQNAALGLTNSGNVINGAGDIVINGTASAAYLTIESNATLVVNNLLVQYDELSVGNSAADNSGITINAGGIYDLDDAGAANDIYSGGGVGVIKNAGLFQMYGYGNDTNDITLSFINTGTLAAYEGTLALEGGGTLGGTLLGPGAIELESGKFSLSTSLVSNGATLDVYGNYPTLALAGTTVALSATTYLGSDTSPVDIIGPGTLKLTGTAYIDYAYVSNKAVIEDSGTIFQINQLDLDYNQNTGGTTTDTSSLIIDAGAVYNIVGQGAVQSITQNADGSVVNNGLLETSGYFTAGQDNYISAPFINTGTVLVNGTDLQLQDGGTIGGTLAGSGELDLSAGTFQLSPSLSDNIATFGLLGGVVVSLGGNVTLAGMVIADDSTIALGGHVLALAGSSAFTTQAGQSEAVYGPGTLQVTGTMAFGASGSEDLFLYGNAVLEDSGTIIASGALDLNAGNAATDTSRLSIDAGAVYNMVNSTGLDDGGNSGANTVSNAGLFEYTGTGADEIAPLLVNTGTVLATSGTLQLDSVANDSNGTLTGGTWEAVGNYPGNYTYAGAIDFNADPAITTDAANIILYGTSENIYSGVSAPVSIESSLTSIAAGGTLQVFDRDVYLTTNTITDSGIIILNAAVLTAAALTITAGGSLSGGDFVVAPVLNNGEITANGVLTIVDTVNGGGGLLIDQNSVLQLGTGIASGETITFGGTGATLIEQAPSAMAATLAGFGVTDTIDIASTTVTAASLSGANLLITLSGGAVLDEALAGTISGLRAGISSDGASGTDITLYREATGTVTPTTLTLGNHHVGDNVSGALTISNTQIADGYSEALDASFASHTGSITTAGSVSLLAAGSTSTALSVTLGTGSAGSIAGSAVVTLATDGSSTDGLGPIGLGTQTIAVTGGVYALASGHLASSTIALGNIHVGGTDTAFLTLSDATTNAAYTEALDAAFIGGTVLYGGRVALLAAGSINSSALTVGLATGTAGAFSGTDILGLTSDGTVIDGLGTTALASQTVFVTGQVFNEATAGLAGTVSLGQHHTGATVSPQVITLTNSAPSGIYSEGLDASFGTISLTTGSFSASGTVTTLTAGGSNASSLDLKLGVATAGTVSGTAVINVSSDGKNIDTLGTTALAAQTIAVSGAVFNFATASVSGTIINFGQHHAGVVVPSQAVTIKNTAAAGAYSEGLDAKFTGTTLTHGSFSTAGTITTLGAGSSNASSLAITMGNATGGTISGTATIGLTSDGTGIDTLASTALTSQVVTITGAVYNYATASIGTLSLGEHHAGDIVIDTLTVTNTAVAGAYSEGLDAKFSGTTLTHGSLTTSGSISLLAAGSINSSALDITLATGTAGSIAAVSTIGLTSDSTSIDTLASSALTSKTVTLSGGIYNYAAASLVSGSTISFGVVHVGDTLAKTLVLTDATTNAAYSEKLDASFSGTTGSVTDSGAILLLGAGLTNSSGLQVTLSSAASGSISGTAVLGLTSDGTGIDTLGTTALANQTINLSGTVDNYATAAIEQLSGSGNLTGSGGSYTLALGTIQQGSGTLVAGIGALNSAAGLADLLGGGWTISNASGAFTDTGFGTFSGLGAGQADALPSITLSGTNSGSFSELITLSSAGSNASGYSGTLANITLDVTGTVLHTSTVTSYTLTSGADTIAGVGNDTIIAASGQLSTGDIINAGSGTNTLALTGGGVFDMRAPSSLSNIQIVDAQEGIGSLVQTLYVDAGFSGTINAASGTTGSSFIVYGNTDSASINLGNGNDIVYLGSAQETVNGGGGNDIFYVTAGDIGATINGGAGINTLDLDGGGNFTMGANITSITSLIINELSTQSTTFTANTTPNLAINGGIGTDTIILGAASQSVTTGFGTTTIDATAAQAGAAIINEGVTALDITTGGTAALNANDDFLMVSLSSALNLTLSAMSFITAIGSSGNDTITALAGQQTLTGGAGLDTLIGYAGFGDTFLDTTTGLNGDTIKYFGGNDLIDITNLARSGAGLAYTGTSTAGTLSLSESGLGVVAAITLTAGTNLSQSLFHMSSDGHGGTYIALI